MGDRPGDRRYRPCLSSIDRFKGDLLLVQDIEYRRYRLGNRRYDIGAISYLLNVGSHTEIEALRESGWIFRSYRAQSERPDVERIWLHDVGPLDAR
jgi:hypothetical protein